MLIMRTLLLTFLISSLFIQSWAQQDPHRIDMKLAPSATVNISQTDDPWLFGIKSLGDTIIGNKEYGESLKALKMEVARRYPRREGKAMKQDSHLTFTLDTPSIHRNFRDNIFSGVPNDNTLAISNGNKLMSAINTTIYIYDVDSIQFLKALTLNVFSAALNFTSTHRYDPKLMYDPDEDKFIIVFLAGASSDVTSHIILGFSETNDPMGNWSLYTLPGNPLPGDTSWTDYPAVALSETEFFVTGNLLRYGGTWQASFKQSVIWQMDKKAAFQGDSLYARLYYDIGLDGKPVRNIHPVQGGDHLYGPDLYFLSNRNFDLQNDTIFLIHVSGERDNPSTRLTVRPLIADRNYGAPPLARQAFTHTLETNDARVLGAFYQNGKIQFVGNTIDTTNGFAAVYHGIIKYPASASTVHANILTDTVLDFGYPKITYTGINPWEDLAMITFDHTSPNDPAGISAIYFKGNDTYSQTKRVHEGSDYVNVMSGYDERWGDYTGSQRKYNEPGIVWMSGYYGIKSGMQRVNMTWVAELESPDVIVPKPSSSILANTYPNPVVDNLVSMEIFLPSQGELLVRLYDMSGRLVANLHQGSEPEGYHLVTFTTESLSKGIYLLRFEHAGKEFITQKLIIP